MHPDSQRPLTRFLNAGLATGIALVSFTTGANAQSDALQRCRAIAEPVARLACYDAIPMPSRAEAAREAKKHKLLDTAPVESSVGSTFAGWAPNERIHLANGQVWQVVDGTVHAVAPGARKAKIRPGVLGSYFLDIEGVSASPRVRRVQ
jgi:hypothetical protein